MNQKGSILVPIIAVVLGTAAVFTVVYFAIVDGSFLGIKNTNTTSQVVRNGSNVNKVVANTNNTVTNTNSAVNTNSTTVIPASWKTYTNNTYGVSFRYPADWTISPDSAGFKACLGATGVFGVQVTDSASPISGAFELAIAQNPSSLTPTQWITKYPVTSATNSSLIRNVADATLGGQSAKEATVFVFDENDYTRIAVSGTNMVCATQHDRDVNDPKNAEHLAITAQIVSSIAF